MAPCSGKMPPPWWACERMSETPAAGPAGVPFSLPTALPQAVPSTVPTRVPKGCSKGRKPGNHRVGPAPQGLQGLRQGRNWADYTPSSGRTLDSDFRIGVWPRCWCANLRSQKAACLLLPTAKHQAIQARLVDDVGLLLAAEGIGDRSQTPLILWPAESAKTRLSPP